MKQKVLFLILTLVLVVRTSAQQYEGYSNLVSISAQPDLFEVVEQAITQKLNAWLVKDQFEKMDAYQARTSKEGIEKQKEIFTSEVINNLAAKAVNWKDGLLTYDPDHETYKIQIRNLKPFLVKVPANEEAQSFKDNYADLIFQNTRFTIEEELFILLDADIKNPTNDITYVLDKTGLVHATAELNVNIGKISLNLPSGGGQEINEQVKKISVGQSDVDMNLPKTKASNPFSFAVVIGNKDYKNIKNKNVDFAINDALMVKRYLIDVLGYKEGNIIYKENANKGEFESIFGTKENYKAELFSLVNNPEAEVFVYYSGHGAPSIKNKKGYIVPVECVPNNVEFGGYPLEQLYANLGKINAKFTTVVVDACYSGNIYENMSPLGIPIDETQFEIPNGVVITATSTNQTANWYPEQQHGLFTYYFLKAMQNLEQSDKNKDNNLSVDEVYQFINDNNNGVPYQARLIGQPQNPTLKGNGKNKILITY
jgi:hypothetical protein